MEPQPTDAREKIICDSIAFVGEDCDDTYQDLVPTALCSLL